MAVNWQTFDAAVLSWLQTATSFKASHVILAYQNAVRPGLPYVEANTRFSITDEGMRDEEQPDDSIAGQLDTVTRSDVTVSCRFLGPGAMAAAASAKTFLQHQDIRDTFAAAATTVLNRGNVSNITSMLETTWQEEASLDVILSVTGLSSQTPGWIQDIGITGSVGTTDDY